MENSEKKQSVKKVDLEKFMQDYNSWIEKLPLTYIFGREILSVFYFIMRNSVRSDVFQRMFEYFMEYYKDEDFYTAFDFTQFLESKTLDDLFSSDEIKRFFYLSLPQNVDDFLNEEE